MFRKFVLRAWRNPRARQGGAAAALAAFLAGAVWVALAASDPGYRFPTAGLVDPGEAETVAAVTGEFRRVRDSASARTDPAMAKVLDVWLRMQTNAAYDAWPPMIRALSAGGSIAPEMKARLAAINGVLSELTQDPAAPTPARLRAMVPEASEAALEAWSASRSRAACERDWASLAGRPSTSLLIRRSGWPAWPSGSAAPVREWVRSRFGLPSLRTLWFEALERDAAELGKLQRWYEAVSKIDTLPLSTGKESGLTLRPFQEPGLPSAAYQGYGSRIDVEVMLELPYSNSGSVGVSRIDTGLRIIGVGMGPQELGPNDRLQPILDPTALTYVDVSAFNRFVHVVGMDEAFVVVDVQPKRNADASGPVFEVEAKLKHRDVPAFAWPARFTLSSADGRAILEAVDAARRRAAEEFDRFLPSVSRMDGWNVRIEPRTGESGRFRASVDAPGVGALTLSLRRRDDGRLSWADATSSLERRAITAAVAKASPDLAPLDALLSVERLTFDPSESPAELRGEAVARLSGVEPGLPDSSRITWSIDAAGRVRTSGLSISDRDSLRKAAAALRRPPAPSSSARRPWTQEALRQDVEAALVRAYPKLASHIEPGVSGAAAGAILDLSLRVDDWPLLTFGPRLVKADDDAERIVRELLSESAVKERSAQQWSGAAPHPRRGRIASRIKEWHPEEGKITVENALPIHGLLKANWQESIAAFGSGWSRLSETAVEQALEPFVQQLEGYVRTLSRAQLGIPFEAGVDRGRFGGDRWLQFDPPNVALYGKVQPIPLLPLKASVMGAALNPSGLSLKGVTASGEWNGTFLIPSPFGPPVASISDPWVGYDFKNSKVELGGSVTPPTPTFLLPKPASHIARNVDPGDGTRREALKAAGFDPSGTRDGAFRFDNPWLHFSYLKTAFGFGLTEATGRGGLVLFGGGRPAAEGRAKLDFEHFSLEGSLEGRRVPYSFVPNLDGDFAVNRRGMGGFHVHGRAELACIELELNLGYPGADHAGPRRIALEGSGKAPLIGRLNLFGDSDLRFTEPRLKASGRFHWLSRALRYTLRLARTGYRLDTEWTSADGETQTLSFNGASFDQSEADRIGRDLERAFEREGPGGDAPTASAEELALLEPLSPPPEPTRPPAPREPPDAPPPPSLPAALSSAGRPPVRDDALQISLQGDRLRIAKIGEAAPIVDLPASSLGVEGGADALARFYQFKVWETSPSGGEGALLIFDAKRRSLGLVRLTGPQQAAGGVEHPGAELAPLGPLVPAPGAPDVQSSTSLNFQAAITVVSARLAGFKAASVRRVGAGTLVEVVRPAGAAREERIGIASWYVDGETPLAYFYEWLVPADRWSEAASRIVQSPRPLQPATVVLAVEGNPPSVGRIAWLWKDPTAPAGAPAATESWRICIDAAAPQAAATLESHADDGFRARIRQLGAATQSSWSGGPSFASGQAFCGPEGVCLAVDDGWWLWESRPKPATAPVLLTKEAFRSWADPVGAAMLPKSLADAASRTKVDVAELARNSVRPWLLARERWGANPMALLVQLARGAEGRK